MSLPTELLMQAQELDENAEEIRANLPIPEGKFSQDAVNRMIGALNEVLMLFEDEYPMVEEDMTMFPEDLVDKLMMIDMATEDADVDFDISIGDISDDRDLALVAGKLTKLAKDRDFKRFLQSDSMTGDEEVIEEEVTVEEMPEEEPMDMDAMFAGRM